jgi:hypothetical protein
MSPTSNKNLAIIRYQRLVRKMPNDVNFCRPLVYDELSFEELVARGAMQEWTVEAVFSSFFGPHMSALLARFTCILVP